MLKLKLLPDEYVAGACFFYVVAQSMHALQDSGPLASAALRVKAPLVYKGMCGLKVDESALSVDRAMEKDTWAPRPGGGGRPRCPFGGLH